MRERVTARDWKGLTAGKLVALYWVFHEHVYGTIPAELDRATVWTMAMKCAGGMVRDHFDGDVEMAVRFMRWVWHREIGKEKWKREKNIQGTKRITWQNQFRHDYLVSDWRAEKSRHQNRG
jgi:hypothetical protein